MCTPFGVSSDSSGGDGPDANGGEGGSAEAGAGPDAAAPEASMPDPTPCTNAETFDSPTLPPPWKPIKTGNAVSLDFGVVEQNRAFLRARAASTSGAVESFVTRDLKRGRPVIEVDARLPVQPLPSAPSFVQLINIYCDGPPNTAATVGLDGQGLFLQADDGTMQGRAPLGDMVPGSWVTFRIVVANNVATLIAGTSVFQVMTPGKLADGDATCHVELGVQAQAAIPQLTVEVDRFCER